MNRPLVREEAFRAVYRWLATEPLTPGSLALLAHLLVTALTDAWSAIRKAAAAAVGRLLPPLLSPPQLVLFHAHLLSLSEELLQEGGPAAGGPDLVDATPTVGGRVDALPRPLLRRHSEPPPRSTPAGASGPSWGSTAPRVPPQQHGSQWKALEGLMLGITAMIRASKPADALLEAGRYDALRPTLYRLLAHPQISVRETARSAFLAALDASGASDGVFVEVMNRLASGAPSDPVSQRLPSAPLDRHDEAFLPAEARSKWEDCSRTGIPGEGLETLSVESLSPSSPLSPAGRFELEALARSPNPDGDPFLSIRRASDSAASLAATLYAGGPPWTRPPSAGTVGHLSAFEAEGLLSLAAAVLPGLPPCFVLRNWGRVWPVLEAYLSHAASTVRQACSALFRAALDAAPTRLHPILVRLMLQSISAGWHVDSTSLSRLNPTTPSPSPAGPSHSPSNGASSGASLGVAACSPASSTAPHTARWPLAAASTAESDAALCHPKPRLEAVSERQLSWQSREGRLLALELVYDFVRGQHEAAAEEVPVTTSREAGATSPLRARRASFDTAATPRSFLSPAPAPAATVEAPQSLLYLLRQDPPPAILCATNAFSLPTPPARSTLAAPSEVPLPCADSSADRWVWECDGTNAEREAEEWARALNWVPFGTCLQLSLLQVTQCFADRRFEVRRMADQLLRPLTEVALAADLPVLQGLWASFLPLVDSLPCWVGASTLLLALNHAQHSEDTRPSDVPRPTAPLALPQRVRALLPELLGPVSDVVAAATSDKVVVVGMQLLARLLGTFRSDLALSPQRRATHTALLSRALLEVSAQAHPDRSLEGLLRDEAGDRQSSDTSPSQHPPSPVAASGRRALPAPIVSGRDTAHARLIASSLLTAVHAELPAVCEGLERTEGSEMLLYVLSSLRLTVRDPPLLLPLLEAVDVLLTNDERCAESGQSVLCVMVWLLSSPLLSSFALRHLLIICHRLPQMHSSATLLELLRAIAALLLRDSQVDCEAEVKGHANTAVPSPDSLRAQLRDAIVGGASDGMAFGADWGEKGTSGLPAAAQVGFEAVAEDEADGWDDWDEAEVEEEPAEPEVVQQEAGAFLRSLCAGGTATDTQGRSTLSQLLLGVLPKLSGSETAALLGAVRAAPPAPERD